MSQKTPSYMFCRVLNTPPKNPAYIIQVTRYVILTLTTKQFKKNSSTRYNEAHKYDGFSLRMLNVTSNICLFKVSNRNTRKRCEIRSNVTIKTPEQRQ